MLQIAAWVNMLVTYSAEKGVVTGVKETFDGEHPCAMCELIAEVQEKQSEEPDSPALPFGKFSLKELLVARGVDIAPMPERDVELGWLPAAGFYCSSFARGPNPPPPRLS